jgi:putative acetyltransferase
MQSNVDVRPAVGNDARALVNLHFASVRHFAAGHYPTEILQLWSTPPDDRRYERMRLAIASDVELVLVAESMGAICGFGSIVATEQELRSLYVDPAFGRRGIGSALLSRLELLAVAKGMRELQLKASLNAEAFYRKRGFKIIRQGLHRLSGGIDMQCLEMRKSLTEY